MAEKHRTEKLSTREVTPPNNQEICIGVAWESPTVATLNAILVDVIAMNGVVNRSGNLVVVCDTPKFLKRACKALGIDVVDKKDRMGKVSTWKWYFTTVSQEAAFPMEAGITTVYTKRVGAVAGEGGRIKPNDPRYPSLYNPSDNKIVPPGRNPSVNRLPPYQSGPWSAPDLMQMGF